MPQEETIFDTANTPNTQEESFVDKYVGEGKKYKSIEDLGKAYANAENFINTLKSETGELKEFITAQFKERAEQPRKEEPIVERRDINPSLEPKQKVEEVDINARIKEALKEQDEQNRAKQNSQITEAAMVSKYGSKETAVSAIKAKAEELGVSPQWIADTAFTNPKAFFKLMDIDAKSTSTPRPASDINPVVLKDHNSPKPGTQAYYNNLRKTDPKTYRLPETQNAMMKDALEKGDDFFN